MSGKEVASLLRTWRNTIHSLHPQSKEDREDNCGGCGMSSWTLGAGLCVNCQNAYIRAILALEDNKLET